MEQITTIENVPESASWASRAATPGQEKLTPAEVEELLARLAKEAERRKRKRNVAKAVWTGYIALVVGLLATQFITHTKGVHIPFINLFFLFGGIGAASKLQKESVRKLAKNPDVRGVGYFVDALTFKDKDVAREADAALVVLLPQLKASDAHLLNDEQRDILYKQLRGDDTELIVAILKALEQVGDEKAVPFVQERIDRKHSGGDILRIQTAAQECMPALKARVEREKAAQTLLRASETTAPDSDVLLRPATGSSGDTENLLLPVETAPGNDHEYQPHHAIE